MVERPRPAPPPPPRRRRRRRRRRRAHACGATRHLGAAPEPPPGQLEGRLHRAAGIEAPGTSPAGPDLPHAPVVQPDEAGRYSGPGLRLPDRPGLPPPWPVRGFRKRRRRRRRWRRSRSPSHGQAGRPAELCRPQRPPGHPLSQIGGPARVGPRSGEVLPPQLPPVGADRGGLVRGGPHALHPRRGRRVLLSEVGKGWWDPGAGGDCGDCHTS